MKKLLLLALCLMATNVFGETVEVQLRGVIKTASNITKSKDIITVDLLETVITKPEVMEDWSVLQINCATRKFREMIFPMKCEKNNDLGFETQACTYLVNTKERLPHTGTWSNLDWEPIQPTSIPSTMSLLGTKLCEIY